MASLFPCPESLSGCDCSNFPVANFSQEAPDLPVNFCEFDRAPVAGTFFAPGCFAQCESFVSLEDCVECAERASFNCPPPPPPPPPQCLFPPCDPPPFVPPVPRGVFLNTFQSCTVECPDGSSFTDSVAAGTVASYWQADANERAHALACKRATAKRLCFVTDATLDSMCVGVAMTRVFDVFGGTPPYTYAHTLGSLPPGTNFDGNGTLFGTPSIAGSSTFTIQVTDADGSMQTKDFTIRAVNINSPATLTSGTVGTAYNYLLSESGAASPLWTLAIGSLPAGLSLNSITGVISGTPTAVETAVFTLDLLDSGNVACSKEFTIAVSAAIGLRAYWAFESLSGGTFLLDSTGNSVELDSSFDGSIVAGKVGNCFEMASSTNVENFDNFAPLKDVTNGFTVAGWFRAVDFQESISIATMFRMDWGVDFLVVKLDGAGNYEAFMQVGIDSADVLIPAIDDNGWHFYRAWYDQTDGKVRLQIDNGAIQVSVGVIPVPAVFASANPLIGNGIASIPGNTRQWDETGIWTRVLSNTEETNLWNGGSGITFGNPLMPP